ACLQLGIAASSPLTTMSVVVQAPDGYLADVRANTIGCWSLSSIIQQANSQWLITLQNNCPTVPMGVQSVGSLCFKAVSRQSVFVPLVLDNLLVTNPDTSHPSAKGFGGRAVMIANEPLLETVLGAN